MPRSKDVQSLINALVRHRQFPRTRVVQRPPVTGSTGFAETGNQTPVPQGAGGLVYVPLAYEAAWGWGEPFGPNPPMGTVQIAWDPSAKIYRVIDKNTGAWIVTHQRGDLACGAKWWLAPNGIDLISWVAVNGWRDLAASEASVPVGAQPVFQNGDVLTYHATADTIHSVVHDGTYLYIAYVDAGQTAYIERTALTLGAGFQAPAWTGTGGISLPAPEGVSYDAMFMDLRPDASECLLNVLSIGRDIPAWNTLSMRFYEEWTLDLTAFPAVTAIKTGDVDASLAHTWDTAEGKTIEEALALLEASGRGFQLETDPPLEAPVISSARFEYHVGDWTVDSYLLSWYDRETQQRQRYTARMNVEYEQALPCSIGYQEHNDVLFPGVGTLAYCHDTGSGELGCVKDALPFTLVLGQWGQSLRKLYAHATLSLRLNSVPFENIELLAQEYTDDSRGGYYANWTATTGPLPCTDTSGPFDRPCGDGVGNVQRLNISPIPVAEQPLDQWGLEFPPSGEFRDLDYALRNAIVVANHGDLAEVRGGLLQHAAEQVIDTVGGTENLAEGQAHYHWRIHDRIAGAPLLEQTRNDVVLSNNGTYPPSHDKHAVAPALPSEQAWGGWIRSILTGLPSLRLYDHAVHFQPCIRLPDGVAFASFALYDNFPTAVPQSVIHLDAFGAGDLVVLTGLDQVTATGPRYTKLLENGTSGAALIVPGKQALAGVI